MYYEPYTPRRRHGCLGGLARRLLYTVARLALLIVIVAGVLYVLGMYFPPIGAFVDGWLERVETWRTQLDIGEYLRTLQGKWINR